MRPVDRLLLGFLALIGAMAALFVPSPWPLVGAIAAMAAALLASARLAQGRPAMIVLHAFLPVPILALLLNGVGPVIDNVNRARWDSELAAVDAGVFGSFAVAWRSVGGRPHWLTDAASAAYAAYYLLPVGAAAVLWVRRRFDEFDHFTFSIATALLASYAAYVIAPATGPRVPEALAQAQLGGGWISAGLRAFLLVCERNLLDAFPSGHTAVSLVFLGEAWRLFPRRRAPLAAAVFAIVFSTVYLSLHYVVDVVAGVALAAAVWAILPRLRRICGCAPALGVRWRAA